MSGTVPPIPPSLGTNTRNAANPNRVNTIPNANTNNMTTNNLAQNVVNEDLPQLLDSRGGSHVTNVPDFDKEDFSSWKDRFLVYLDGLEPYLLEVLGNGTFVHMPPLSTFTNPLTKPKRQWSPEDRKHANQDKRLKSIIISCLPNDMKYVIKCTTTKAMWTDLVLAHEGPSDTRDTKIAALRLKFNVFKPHKGEKVNGTFTRLKCLLNDLENNGVSIPEAKVNDMFVNSLPKKWLSMNQTQRANNSIKNDSLATLYGKYNYEEGVMYQIYKSESTRFSIQASNSKALISNTYLQDNNADVEEDTRSNSEFLADLNAEFHDRALLTNQKRFYKRPGRVGSTKKPMDKSNETNFAYSKDEESVSSDNKGVTKVKAFMAIDEDESSVGKADARSGQWVEITMKKRKNLLSKFNSLSQELSSCKSELCDLKNTKSLNCSLQNEIARLNLEKEYLKDEISDLKKVIEKWTSSKVTLDQPIIEQVPRNIVRALGRRGKRKETISSKEVVFSKADESPSETAPEITFNSESECDVQEPLPPLPKLSRAGPIAIQAPKKKAQTVSPFVPDPIPVKKADSSTKKLLLTLMEDVKGLKEQIKTPLDNSAFVSQTGSSKSVKGKQKTGMDLPGCDICGSIAHETADCAKKPSSKNKTLRIANWRSTEPTKKKIENLNEVRLKELRSNNGTEFRNHKLEDFLAKAFRVFNIRRQEIEETYYVTFSEDDEAISKSSTEGDEINFNENRSFLDDKFLIARSKVTQSFGKDYYFPYVPVYDPLSITNITIPDHIIPTDSPTLQDINSPEESPEFTIVDDHLVHNEPDDFELADNLEPAEV
ncbi:hypothetical protein Tco_0816849 [Tanacetum coccineum]